MTDWSFAFAPLVPWLAIAVIAAAAAALTAFSGWRHARGTLWRALAFGFLLLALARPQWLEEQREPHRDVAIAIVDVSPSQKIGARAAQRDTALAELRAAAKALPNLEWREVEAGAPDTRAPGTRLFEAWRRAVADVPPSRRAGVIILSDGQVHDLPGDSEATGPLHLLLTGQKDERDRRLGLQQAPRYGIVGEDVMLTVQVDDLGVSDPPALADIRVRRDGQDILRTQVETGTPALLKVPLVSAGSALVEVVVADGPAELTRQNNRVIASVNAVRDRLRVLLISGSPHAGGRVWRNLLKSDPSVDLVHFTILRPPTKQDLTPVEELSLIAFPVRQLFQEKLDEFDLIVFDRYTLRGLISPAYLTNVADFARNGGAVLVAVGPTYADRYASVHNSPIGDIMPTAPTQRIIEQGFRPTVTSLGQRHPVTRNLAGTDEWGRWFRQIEASVTDGQVLMAGVENSPLLVLNRVGNPSNQGRVAQFLSDHIWLWARGFEGGGPHGELLRRLAHWLMKEPELEEEALLAEANGSRLTISRHSLLETPPIIRVTGPDGAVLPVPLEVLEPGRFGASLTVAADGLYQVEDGQHTVVVPVGVLDARELEDPRASAAPLAETVATHAGSTHWLADGLPALRQIQPNRLAAGRGWLGLRQNGAHNVVGLTQTPLLPTWLSLLLSAALLTFTWWREAR